jgi:hypothetical protein
MFGYLGMAPGAGLAPVARPRVRGRCPEPAAVTETSVATSCHAFHAGHRFKLERAEGATVLRPMVEGCTAGEFEAIWSERPRGLRPLGRSS